MLRLHRLNRRQNIRSPRTFPKSPAIPASVETVLDVFTAHVTLPHKHSALLENEPREYNIKLFAAPTHNGQTGERSE